VPGTDPTHWLHRLSAAEWLAAAATELDNGQAALARRATRTGITHARRAAGMAWNAVLIVAPPPDDRYGRSYMEHVVALAQPPASAPAPAADAGGGEVPDDVRAAARLLRDTPPRPPDLITIGKPDMTSLDAARAIVDYARGYVSEKG
jgi:hypothetical protein